MLVFSGCHIGIIIMLSTFFYDVEKLTTFAGVAISIATLIELFATGYKAREKMNMIPVDIEEVINRCSVFTMLVLGESIIQLLIPVFNTRHMEDNYVFTLQGLVFVYFIALQYFDTAPQHIEKHAMSRSFVRGAIWLWTHLILSFGLLLVGISLKLLYYHLKHGSENNLENDCMLLAYSTGVSLVAVTVIRIMHQGFDLSMITNRTRRTLAYAARFVFASLHFLVPLVARSNDPNSNVLVHLILTLIMVIIDASSHKKIEMERDGTVRDFVITSGRITSVVRDDDDDHQGMPSISMNASLISYASGFDEERGSDSLFLDPSYVPPGITEMNEGGKEEEDEGEVVREEEERVTEKEEERLVMEV